MVYLRWQEAQRKTKKERGEYVRAIETTGTIEGKQYLHLSHPLPHTVPQEVRVIVLFPERGEEWEKDEWLRIAASNPAFDFLKDPAEDIYTLTDGIPFNDKG